MTIRQLITELEMYDQNCQVIIQPQNCDMEYENNTLPIRLTPVTINDKQPRKIILLWSFSGDKA